MNKQEYNKQYYRDHKDKLLEQQAKYASKHKDELAEYNEAYRAEHKDEIAKIQSEYHKKNREERNEYARQWRIKNAEEVKCKRHEKYEANKLEILGRNKKWRDKNITPEQQKENNRRYRDEHIDEIRAYDAKRSLDEGYRPAHRIHEKKYYEGHKPERIARQTIYKRHKRRTDPQFRLASNLRSRLYDAYKGYRKGSKCVSAVNDCGCTRAELVKHIESQWLPGMSHDNYGTKAEQWCIDHINPLDNFDLTIKEQALQANHYMNLQPMWNPDNLHKSNKLTS